MKRVIFDTNVYGNLFKELDYSTLSKRINDPVASYGVCAAISPTHDIVATWSLVLIFPVASNRV